MSKFNIGAKVKATKGSQMGNVGTVRTVLLSTPSTETEYEISFDTKPYYLTLPESNLRGQGVDAVV